MSPITKENEVLTPAQNPATTASSSTGFRPDETASRPQPVALEVPVTVNGARTAEGSDKREPFAETTKTVLVFGNGAVLRLLSPVSPGQLLFLTNEKTKKEVVCQVVKSKNYRNVSGYVELEFTEAVVGFWGMRFPTDRVAAQLSAQTPVPAARVTPTAPPPVVAKAPTAPVLSAVPKLPEPAPSQVQELPSPVAQVPVIEAAKPILPAVPEPPVTSLEAAALFAAGPVSNQLESPAGESPSLSASLASSMMNLLSSPELPPAAAPTSASPQPPGQPVPFPGNQKPASGENSTEELKLQAARLQEQLSGLVFGGAPEAKPSPKALSNDDNARIASKLLDIAKTEVTPVKSTAAKTVPPPLRSSLDSEEVKIPSWLEPLARNAATPSPTQELVEQERATEASELEAHTEVPEEAPPASVPESASEAQLPGIGSLLPFDEEVSTRERSSGGSKTGLWIGVAAAVVLAAAGAWYFLRPAASVPGTVVQGSAASAVRTADRSSGAVSPATAQPALQPVPQTPVALPEPPAKPAKSETTSEAPLGKSAQTPQPILAVRDDARNSAAAIPAADTERIPKPARSPVAAVAAAEPAPKKQSIGEVHLASPMVNRPATTPDEGEAPSISSINSDGSSANLGAGLAGASSQPTAPEALLPAGGDVTPAKLVSTVSPVYPAIARSQHIEGDVRIDALINENGKVTTMKVISGPALLHQAAMEALRQWKYTPATLDGKPVPMHLSVTLKFRAK